MESADNEQLSRALLPDAGKDEVESASPAKNVFVEHAATVVQSSDVAAQLLAVVRAANSDQAQESNFAARLAYEHLAAASEAMSMIPHPCRPKLRGPGLQLKERLQWYLPPRRPYSRRELLADRAVNFTGAALSWPCGIWIGYMSLGSQLPEMQRFCCLLYGVGLVAMTNLSALYHHFAWDWEQAPRVYSPLDQVGINMMIVGGTAPLMVACDGYYLLLLIAVLGAVGMVLQILRFARVKFSPLRLKKGARWTILDWINVLHYVLMAISVVAIFPALADVLPFYAACMAIGGGTTIVAGVPFLLFERLEFHQAYWHSFVLVGSAVYTAFIMQIVRNSELHA